MDVYKVFAEKQDGELESCIMYHFAGDLHMKQLRTYLGKLVHTYKPGKMIRYAYPRFVYRNGEDALRFMNSAGRIMNGRKHINWTIRHRAIVVWRCEAPEVHEIPYLPLYDREAQRTLGYGKPISWFEAGEENIFSTIADYNTRYVVDRMKMVQEVERCCNVRVR